MNPRRVVWSKIRKQRDSTLQTRFPSVWVCFGSLFERGRYQLSFYEVNPGLASEDDEAPSPKLQLPLDLGGVSSVVVDSTKFYFIGSPLKFDEEKGTDSTFYELSIHSGRLSVNPSKRICEFRFKPLLVAVDGKLYVVGAPYPDSKSKCWGEVFDFKSSKWVSLDDPPVEDCGLMAKVYVKEMKEFLVNIWLNRWWRFSTVDHVWRKLEPAPDHVPYQLFYDAPATKLIVGDILYIFHAGVLHAFDLTTTTNSHIEIHGLEDHTFYLDPDCTRTYLFHFGKTTFCLVWCVRGFDDKQRVCFVTFDIVFPKANKRPPRALVRCSASYLFPGSCLCDCTMASFRIPPSYTGHPECHHVRQRTCAFRLTEFTVLVIYLSGAPMGFSTIIS